jgi:hypothetical protein
MSAKYEQLELHKRLLQLQLEEHRLELSADLATLRNPLRKAAIGTGMLALLRKHPVLLTTAGAMLAKIPRLGFAAKAAGVSVAVWQAVKLYQRWRS